MLRRSRLAIVLTTIVGMASSVLGQQSNGGAYSNQLQQVDRGQLQSVRDLLKRFDKNNDGELTEDEVTLQPFTQNFSRWDADRNGTVTEAEITEFRRRLGIPVEGTSRAADRPVSTERSSVAELTIPDVDELERVGRGAPVSREVKQNSAFIIATQPHAVDGDRYVILTDHTEQNYLEPLQRLANHHDGVIVTVNDLGQLHQNAETMNSVRNQLRDAKVRFLAIAPRMETYRENMLLGMWELITTIDSDPQLDAFPGLLLASNAEDFAGLIDRSINYKPLSAQDFRPFAISQVPSMQELRSLQKSGILRNLFGEYGFTTPTVGVYSPLAADAPKLSGDKFWSYMSRSRGDFLKQFPEEAASDFNTASLLVMHGHGVPGMSCGVDICAIPENLSAKIVLCGSCFSAAPKKSDFPAMRQAPGGSGIEARDAFAVRAIDQGACVAFGHMRLSQGFPHLYPVLESWMNGKTVGEAYQELINAIIDMQGTEPGDFTVSDKPATGRQPPQNILLYVIIGDPAIRPIEFLDR
jgi:hypothetical protein